MNPMPKIDIAKLPVDTRIGYPAPFDRVVVGRERNAWATPWASTSSASI
jgi:hypothetical protein